MTTGDTTTPWIEIQNDGPLLRSTNYWQTPPARRGVMLLSGNAGALRLLVPRAAMGDIAQMRTGTRVTIERSLSPEHEIDIVFEDGTDEPYCVLMQEPQLLAVGGRGREVRFLVYSPAGLELELLAEVKT